jgi:hypothetical protein
MTTKLSSRRPLNINNVFSIVSAPLFSVYLNGSFREMKYTYLNVCLKPEKRPRWHRVSFLSLFGRERHNMFFYGFYDKGLVCENNGRIVKDL